MSHLAKDLTLKLTVTGVRTWKLRQRLGILMIQCAAFVMGVGFTVEYESNGGWPPLVRPLPHPPIAPHHPIAPPDTGGIARKGL